MNPIHLSALLSFLSELIFTNTKLTPAERAEVIRMAQGMATKEAAAAAGISIETARARRKRIYRKFDVHTCQQLLSKFLVEAIETRTMRAAS
jgi:DNA-binding CsgD family transcriptional regulator